MRALAVSTTAVVDEIDRILSERGRRSHRFAWLLEPGGGRDEWLPVAAYYPGNRVVVVCHDGEPSHRDLLVEAVPAHGLHLLEVTPERLPEDGAAVRRELERLVGELGPIPDRRPAAKPSPAPAAPALPLTRSQRAERQVMGVLAGLALLFVLVLELYVGVAGLGFDSGRVLLGFGFALDACARTLGTVAAWRAGSAEWAWWCLLGGSLVTVPFALMQGDGPVRTEPAPLAGLVGVVALAMLALGVIAG